MTTRPEWAGTVQGGNMVEATEAGYREFKALWNAHREKPDGLVSCDDYATRGVLQAMREMGVVPGKHLHIASHANKGLDLFGGTPVICIEFDLAEIAAALIDLLMGCMDGKGMKATVMVSPHVVED